MKNAPEKQLREIKVSTDFEEVKIKFDEVNDRPPEEGEEESKPMKNQFSVKSGYRPRKQLLETMKKLRKYGLEMLGIDVDPKKLNEWNVLHVKLDGDYFKKETRVTMLLTKYVELTGKFTDIEVPTTTIYGESKYHKVGEICAIIEDLVEEGWLYLAGEYDTKGQFALFAREHDLPEVKKELNFTK